MQRNRGATDPREKENKLYKKGEASVCVGKKKSFGAFFDLGKKEEPAKARNRGRETRKKKREGK